MDERVKKVLAKLEAQCAKREYCTKDVREKALKALEGDADAAKEVVDALKANAFVDDARYASAFAREKSSLTGWGPIKIRFALKAKGLGDADISSGLSEVDAGRADERLAKLLAVKAKSLEGDPQARLKLIRFALTRGYEYDAVESAVKKLESNK
ncbi:MAG: RecX family transcriptional regulator [Bacteroidales bacterium]|nr:RecX family transcriptional regulator [Bacteroidales bacterium]